MIQRHEALEHLEAQSTQRRLVWISAPAGYGKSVLAGQWCRRHPELRVAWLDARHPLDDRSFLARLADAIADLAGVDHPAASVEPAGRAALVALASRCPPSVLVVDGCKSTELGTVLVDLANDLDAAEPRVLRLIVTSRELPPPQLVGLTLRGLSTVVQAEALSVGWEETAAVINELIPGTVDAGLATDLATRLDGWIAGARLVGLSFPNQATPSADIVFGAAADAIDAYVTAELLDGLAGDLRRFALLTAAPQRCDPAMCNVMIGRNDSDALIMRLREAGVPTVRDASQPSVLRYLPPIRDALDRIAMRELPEQRSAAMRAAAEWCSANGQPFDAAWLLVALKAWDEVIGVVFLHLRDILESDQIGQLADLAAAVPAEVLRERAELAIGAAYVLRMDGRVAAAQELLAVFEPHMGAIGQAVADVIRCGLVSYLPDVDAALAYADTAIAKFDAIGEDFDDAHRGVVPPYRPATARTYQVLARSYALLACAYAGHWDRGTAYLADIDAATAATIPHIQAVQRHGSRATYLALAGCPRAAQADAVVGLTLADTADMHQHRVTADAYYGLGEARRLSLLHEPADEALEISRELAEVNQRLNLMASVAASQAHLALDQGDIDTAVGRLEAFRRAGYRPPVTIAGVIAAAEARAHLANRDASSALSTLEAAPNTSATASVAVTVLTSLGQISNARQVLDRWPHRGTTDADVRWHLATALVHEISGERVQADRAFGEALGYAAPDRLLQPFTEVGAVALALLQRVTRPTARPAALELAVELRAALLIESDPITTAALTRRESMVLAQLADSRTTRQIADSLHVSVNTMKTHLRSIYRKLGVASREQAVRAYQTSSRRSLSPGGEHQSDA